MFTDIHPYVVFSILSAIATSIAAMAAWRRSAPGASALRLLLLGMALWSACYATRWLNISVEAKLVWFKVMSIGVASIPTLFLIFAYGRRVAAVALENVVCVCLFRRCPFFPL